jgi:hypothetical protein
MHTVAFVEASPETLNGSAPSNFIGDETTDDNRKEQRPSARHEKPSETFFSAEW